jgi:hypothetical protein
MRGCQQLVLWEDEGWNPRISPPGKLVYESRLLDLYKTYQFLCLGSISSADLKAVTQNVLWLLILVSPNIF